MAIAFGSVGSSGVGTTSVSCGAPASIAAGDLLLLHVLNKYPANPPSTPSGWNLLAQHSAGSGSSGADSGDVILTIYYKIAVGGESTQAVTITGGNSAVGTMTRWTKSASKVWGLSYVTGSDTTPGASPWSASCGAIDCATGDVMVTGAGYNTDDLAFSAPTLSQTSTTFAAGSTRSNPATTNGDDCELVVGQNNVTTGGGTGAITQTQTYTGTPPANGPCGPVIIVRLRELDPSGSDPVGMMGIFGL